MASYSYTRDPQPYIRYTRSATTGLVTEQVINSASPMIKVEGSRTDVVRRKVPADPWASGTGFTVTETVRQALGTGYRTLSPTQWEIAPSIAFWSGSITLNIGEPPNGLAGRLRAKIKNENVNLAQALAEYRKTADLFSSTVNQVVRTFRSLRRGRGIKDVVKYLERGNYRNYHYDRDAAKQWLKYQYGMKPLINDLYGACEELRSVLEEGRWIRQAVSERQVTSGDSVWPTSPPHHGFSSWRTEHDLRLEARYNIIESSVKQLSQVGITNPLELAWEVIPFSFVVDWLFPVGDWLSSLDALVGINRFSYYKIRDTKKVETGTTYGGGWKCTYRMYTRNGPYTDLPLPRLRYEPSDSLTKVLNGIALLTLLKKR